jgi:dephospho-CoA kinase
MPELEIIILAGYSGAGKSTLAREFSKSQGYSFIDHQQIIHDLANQHGSPRARDWLAQIGPERFVQESTQEILNSIKTKSENGNQRFILDAAYGETMTRAIKESFPEAGMLVVAVLAERDIRLARIKKRMGNPSDSIAETELIFRDTFLKQVGLDQVLNQKNIEIYSNNPPDKLSLELIEQIKKLHEKGYNVGR